MYNVSSAFMTTVSSLLTKLLFNMIISLWDSMSSAISSLQFVRVISASRVTKSSLTVMTKTAADGETDIHSSTSSTRNRATTKRRKTWPVRRRNGSCFLVFRHNTKYCAWCFTTTVWVSDIVFIFYKIYGKIFNIYSSGSPWNHIICSDQTGFRRAQHTIEITIRIFIFILYFQL